MTKELKKWKETMIAKYGSEEKLKEHLREVAAIGGRKATGNVGFAKLSVEERIILGRKGGQKSKRTKS